MPLTRWSRDDRTPVLNARQSAMGAAAGIGFFIAAAVAGMMGLFASATGVAGL
jgi:hypothetical protein